MNCFAVVLPGLEKLVRDELAGLSVHDIEVMDGGVGFAASPDALCRVNLRARCITRVLVRLAEFKALSFPELFNKNRKIAWERYISKNLPVQVRASCHQSRLMHSGRVEQAVFDAVRGRLGFDVREASSAEGEIQRVTARLVHDRCVISVDSSGERLDRRGYRLHAGRAPIRETAAAGILQWMAWTPDEPLVLPMCGSGTFAIEAALSGFERAVNLDHAFSMLHWPMLKQRRWQRIRDKAEKMKKARPLLIKASDIDPDILQQAILNAERAGTGDTICFRQLDVFDLLPPHDISTPGVLLCNPPYGERIKGDVSGLYKKLGELFRDAFSGWRMGVIVPDQVCERAIGLSAKRRLKIKHGGKWVHVLHFEGP